MKTLLTLILCCTAIIAHCQQPREGYFTAPAFSISGDFDGDGNQDTLNQFITDSTGTAVQYMKEIDTETWDDYVSAFATLGYRTSVALAGQEDNVLSFNRAQGVYCLVNLGNINNTEGDEIAIIPDFADQSRVSACYVFTLCHGRWERAFTFNVHEDAFDDFLGTPYPSIPGILEQRNGTWMYYDYLDMEYQNAEDVGNMLPIPAGGCE